MNDKGGLAKGPSHKEGGIKATVKSTGQEIEFEGGEVIVNKRNVADETLLEFEGEKKTTCEILSDLNSRNNNGVTLDCDSVEGKKYKYEEGGKLESDQEVDYDSYKKDKKDRVFAENGVKIPKILTLENTLGIDRKKMPQIRAHYIDSFLEKLTEDGIEYSYEVNSPNEIKPTQVHINLEKVSTLNPDYINSRYLIVSNDGYLLDGHHRWYYSKESDLDAKVLKIDLPINELIDYANSFDQIEFSGVHEPVKFEKGGGTKSNVDLWLEARNALVPKHQVQFILEIDDPIEARDMLSNVVKAYKDIPSIGEQDEKYKNSVVYLHYFSGGTDWYVTELDKKSGRMFGYVVLNQDWDMSEFGYIDKNFLIKNNIPLMQKPELDFYWKYKTVNQILAREAPHKVSGEIEIYQEQKTVNSTGTNWQELIEENKFKNPFEKVQAIEKMVDEKGLDPNNYSVIEKKFISEYTGIGGMEKYGAKSRSESDTGLLYEFFTPQNLCEFMWGLAYKHIGTHSINNVLEPSFGAGAFFSVAPINVIIDGYDIGEYQYKICKILYPDDRFRLKQGSFEEKFIKNNYTVKSKVEPYYDLIIGNPPYGVYSGKYSAMGEKKHTKANNFVEYFITRGLDLLRPNGLLVFVIGHASGGGGTSFLESNLTKAKEEIMKKSELVDAYRLGNSMFEFTRVDADIIVLRKK